MVPRLFTRVEPIALGRADASVSAIEMQATEADSRFVSGATRLESGGGVRQKKWLGRRDANRPYRDIRQQPTISTKAHTETLYCLITCQNSRVER
jgi:hypothetical protein